MKTDNELIADFMGQHVTFVGLRRNVMQKSYYADELKYDTSWDWLMPVVQKIETIYSKAFPPGEEFIRRILAHEEPIEEQYVDVLSLPMSTPINEVYTAVVEFIKWYTNVSTDKKQ